jgi:hypothetical protein
VGALGVTGDVNEIDDLCAGIHAGGSRADADCQGGKTSQYQTECAAAGRQGTRAASYLPWEDPSLRPKSPGSARSRGGACISLTMEPVKVLPLSAVARRARRRTQE